MHAGVKMHTDVTTQTSCTGCAHRTLNSHAVAYRNAQFWKILVTNGKMHVSHTHVCLKFKSSCTVPASIFRASSFACTPRGNHEWSYRHLVWGITISDYLQSLNQAVLYKCSYIILTRIVGTTESHLRIVWHNYT